MLKAIFWFVFGTIATLFFAGLMLFVFGQAQRVSCRSEEPGLAACTVSSTLLGVLPLPGWTLDRVVKASVEEDCNDGCTYRTDLVTQSGQSRPINEVWTDQEAQDRDMADQINAFILANDTPVLVIDNPMTAWVIWLVIGLSVMSLLIQDVVLVAQLAKSLFGIGARASHNWR
jgi:hypothetical protein